MSEPTEAPKTGGQPTPRGRRILLEAVAFVCLLAALAVFLRVACAVLIPKRMDYGAVWDQYEKEPANSLDVLFFGSSLVYCDVAPAMIYEESGITSFAMAGPEQTMPVTYRYVREALAAQTPSAILVEATGLSYGRSNRNIKTNIAYMPWGLDRLILTLEEAEPEDRFELLFPLEAFHDRWDELEETDRKLGLQGYEPDPFAGYTWLEKVTPATTFSTRQIGKNEENYSRNLEYAGKIIRLCQEKGIRPVFYLSPTVARLPEALVIRMERELRELGAEFVDFNSCFEEIGFDRSVDFFDSLHLNYRGAQVFGRYLARRLPEWGVARQDRGVAALWEKRVERFHSRAARCDEKPVEFHPNYHPPES